jgi:N-acetylneuraminic acid mutarotase
MDNAVAYNDGKVYSVAGYNGSANVANGNVYDPASQAWSPIANAPEALESPGAAFVNGKMYLVGGWNASGNASTKVYVYDPNSNSWSSAANLPKALSAPAVTALDGNLYVVGGCTTGNCAPTSKSAFRYDPGSDSWAQLADYPVPAAFPACAGIASELVCAGGVNADNNQGQKATYIYDPGSDSWAQGADMPYDDWAMAYAGSDNKLQISAGAINNGAVLTNQSLEYDPSANTWTALANSNNAEYRGGASCGLYKIGGSSGGFNPQTFAEVLPGFDQCGGAADVPWLSESATEFDLAPGQSNAVTVTTDSSTVPQPGAYTGKLAISTDTPYSFAPVGVTMQVDPPKAWGKIAGTVTDAASGAPLAGVTVQIGTFGGTGQVTFTLKTDNTGYYQLWLDARYSPLQLIAAKDGYQPQVKKVKITKGATALGNFALKKV